MTVCPRRASCTQNTVVAYLYCRTELAPMRRRLKHARYISPRTRSTSFGLLRIVESRCVFCRFLQALPGWTLRRAALGLLVPPCTRACSHKRSVEKTRRDPLKPPATCYNNMSARAGMLLLGFGQLASVAASECASFCNPWTCTDPSCKDCFDCSATSRTYSVKTTKKSWRSEAAAFISPCVRIV